MLNGAPGNRLSRAALICPLVFASIGLAQTDTGARRRVATTGTVPAPATGGNDPSPQPVPRAAIASESIAACCFLACTDSTLSACLTSDGCLAGETCVTIDESSRACQRNCVDDTQCPAGTCEPTCGLMDIVACADLDGWFHGPPNKPQHTTSCTGVCDTGSCCTGPDLCEDDVSDQPLSKDDCDSSGGRFIGGTTCCHMFCAAGPRVGAPCCSLSECEGFSCAPIDTAFTQPWPCPVCDIESSSNCQPFDGSLMGGISDRSVAHAPEAVDDFRPMFETIESVCVWGYYDVPDESGDPVDCAGLVSDNFHVTVYLPDADGLPDYFEEVGVSSATAVTLPANYPSCDGGRITQAQATKLILDVPITGLDPSGQTTYWLGVRNDTYAPLDNQCTWHWAETNASYNGQSASIVIGISSFAPNDLSFCLNGDFDAPPPFERACCECSDAACSVTTLLNCPSDTATWIHTRTDCNENCPMLPMGVDDCADVLGAQPLTGQVVENGDNRCATTDGPNLVPTELGTTVMAVNDLWYKYEAGCDGVVVAAACGSGTAEDLFDKVIMAYEGCDTCPNEADHLSRLFPNGTAYDENCAAQIVNGGAVLSGAALSGDCFLVRVAGVEGSILRGDRGAWDIIFSCTPGCWPPQTYPNQWNRYLTLRDLKCVLPPSAIQVTIVDMPLFPEREGETWWAGTPFPVDVGIGGEQGFAELECTNTPMFVDWWPDPQLHLFGAAVLPGSTYEVRHCWNGGASCTDPVTVSTGQWGDVVAPFGGPAQPNFGDISAIVAAFTEAAGAPPLVAADLAGNGGAEVPNQSIDFGDITRDVGAFKGLPYPYPGPSSCAAQ